ncbi:MAG: thioredoxin family protein [Pirellulaceae bacterium]
MRARTLSLVLAVVCAVGGFTQSARAESPQVAWQTDIDAAWRSTKEDRRLLLLFVKSDRCFYCEKMERESYANPGVVKVIGDDYVPAALHASKRPELTKKMGIQAYPTTVLIDSDGQIVDVVEGYVAPDKFLQWLRAAAQRTAKLER